MTIERFFSRCVWGVHSELCFNKKPVRVKNFRDVYPLSQYAAVCGLV